MTRHRRAPLWRRLIQRPAPVVESTTDAVTEPNDLNELAKAVAILDRGVEGTRRQHTPRPDRAHLDRHGPFLPPGAVVPPPAMPGGAR